MMIIRSILLLFTLYILVVVSTFKIDFMWEANTSHSVHQ